jgi:hypothetical protein
MRLADYPQTGHRQPRFSHFQAAVALVTIEDVGETQWLSFKFYSFFKAYPLVFESCSSSFE